MYTKQAESTDFIKLLKEFFKTDQFPKLKNKNFFYYQLGYPEHSKWKSPNASFLKTLSEKNKLQLKKQNAFYVLDCSWEGYSPVSTAHPFFKILYKDCEDLGISPSTIIYVSSNLKDEENIINWCKAHQITDRINVVSYNRFTRETDILHLKKEISSEITEDAYENFKVNEKMFKELYKGKFFTSLSRRNRKWRTISQFFLSTQDFSQYGLFSHDKIKLDDLEKFVSNLELNNDSLIAWKKTLPLLVDRSDFNVNWALTSFGSLYNQTVFHICNETLQDNENNTSLFFSEKTFRPIKVFQPFIIWGQPGANNFLKVMGFKTYEDYFDMSFDSIEDNLKRLTALTNSVREVCKELESMNRDQQMEWRFKSKEILIHNYVTLLSRDWDKNKIYNFLKNLESNLN